MRVAENRLHDRSTLDGPAPRSKVVLLARECHSNQGRNLPDQIRNLRWTCKKVGHTVVDVFACLGSGWDVEELSWAAEVAERLEFYEDGPPLGCYTIHEKAGPVSRLRRWR